MHCRAGGWRSELTEREPDPNKRTNQRNAEAGREGKAKGKPGAKGEKREEREANTEEKQGKGQEEKSKKHTKRRRKRVEPAAAGLSALPLMPRTCPDVIAVANRPCCQKGAGVANGCKVVYAQVGTAAEADQVLGGVRMGGAEMGDHVHLHE